MWSGPRNISTALMRSWGSRSDTFVCDEPFYAHYLKVTGLDHPGASEVITQNETDPDKVITSLTGQVPQGKTIFYQKHMAHHLLPGVNRDWLSEVTNCFLIRDPQEVLTSLIKNIPNPTIEDTGLPQQVEIFERVKAQGCTPPVLDSKDVLERPGETLRLLCESIGVEFQEAMLSWRAGAHETDGIWGKYWYEAVEKSTGFQSYAAKYEIVPPHLTELYNKCATYYQELYKYRLGA